MNWSTAAASSALCQFMLAMASFKFFLFVMGFLEVSPLMLDAALTEVAGRFRTALGKLNLRQL
jgi:hypothetical protein